MSKKPRFINADDKHCRPTVWINTDHIVSIRKDVANGLTDYEITTVTNEHYYSSDLKRINELLFGDIN